MGERLALFGGTFNPIHVGHVAVARAAVSQLGLDRLMLVPSARPPHKTSGGLAPGADRLAMCRLAVEGDKHLTVSDIELRSPKPSYTVNTLRAVGREHPKGELVFLVGADMLRDLHLWYRFEEIVELARVVTVPRPGVALGRLEALRSALGDAVADRLLADVLETPLVDVSSTEIRRRVAAGESIEGLVPAGVARYISEHSLYR